MVTRRLIFARTLYQILYVKSKKLKRRKQLGFSPLELLALASLRFSQQQAQVINESVKTACGQSSLSLLIHYPPRRQVIKHQAPGRVGSHDFLDLELLTDSSKREKANVVRINSPGDNGTTLNQSAMLRAICFLIIWMTEEKHLCRCKDVPFEREAPWPLYKELAFLYNKRICD